MSSRCTHVGDRAQHLADGLANRPEPGAVDVGVPDGAHPVRGGARRRRQHLGERGAGAGRRADDVLVVEQVERAVEGDHELPAPRVVVGQRAHQAVEHLEVVTEGDDVVVPLADLHRVHAVQRRGRGGEPVALVGGAEPVGAEQARVRGRLDPQVDALAGGAGQPGVLRVQALDHRPVAAAHQRLGLESGTLDVPAEVDPQLGRHGVGGHRAGDVEPRGAPGRAPGMAHPDRLVPLPQRDVEPDRLADGAVVGGRDVPGLEREVVQDGALARTHALGEGAGQPGLDLAPAVVHAVSCRTRARGRGTRRS